MDQIVLSILVDNVSGVLSRLSGLFARRAYNIDSITAGVTANPKITRITIVSRGDDLVLHQIMTQLEKQVDVRDIKVLDPNNSVVRELLLIKVMANEDNRTDIIAIANLFRASIVDVEIDSLIIELTGSQPKLEAFLEMLKGYKIAEIARTGLAGLARGTEDVKYF